MNIRNLEIFALTFSNLASIPALYLCLYNGLYIKFISLFGATIASIYYHSLEPVRTTSHIDNLFDFKSNPRLKLDQFFAINAMLTFLNKDLLLDYFYHIVTLLIMMVLSDLVYYINTAKYNQSIIRIILHVPWHLGALGYLPYICINNSIYHNSILYSLIN
jgi:hypothetical protein